MAKVSLATYVVIRTYVGSFSVFATCSLFNSILQCLLTRSITGEGPLREHNSIPLTSLECMEPGQELRLYMPVLFIESESFIIGHFAAELR